MNGATLGWRGWPWLLAATLLLILLVFELSGLARLWDDRGSDWMMRLHARARTMSPDIALIAIDQKSLENMNADAGSWPWPRGTHAELIDGLERQHPRAIVFDLLLNESDTFRPDSDKQLNSVASQYSNLYFPSMLLNDGNGAPLTALPPTFGAVKTPGANPSATAPLLVPLILDPQNWRGGLINFHADIDGVGRREPLFLTVQGWQLPSLPAQVAHDAGRSWAPQESIRLNWHRPVETPAAYSDVFQDMAREHPKRPADEFRDKIVIIGATAPGLADFRPTPLNAALPGFELLATAISNLQQDDWLRDLPSRPLLLMLLLPALAWAFARRFSPWQIGTTLLISSLLLLLASFLLLHWRYFAPVSVALAGSWLLYAALTLLAQLRDARERQAAITLFNRFLDPRVVGDLVRSGEISPDQKAQSREISILFSDIRGFTTLSETRTPEAVVELLNRYFSQQVAVIFKHGGTLDKFIGDAIMAFWNAPTQDADHAGKAVAAAVEMAAVLDDFKRELLALDPDLGDFDIGIGIHTGPAVVGFIGADSRLDYTAIGDTVNLASRIEGCTKGVARVLVSANTREACGTAFSFKDHGLHHVKGRAQGVQLFEPLLQGG